MQIKQLILENVKKAVKSVYDIDLETILIEHPDFGDYSTNVALVLAKTLKQNPMEIAKNITQELQGMELTFNDPYSTKKTSAPYPLFIKLDYIQPGFINFQLSEEWFVSNLFKVMKEKTTYGSWKIGNNTKVIVEFSQPNPNKPLHIGHARNNFLGSSLSNIYSFCGYDVIRTNYMNDWGTHICKTMLMYDKYENNAEPKGKTDHYIGDLYIRYEQEVETNPELEKELAAMFIKLESGDPQTLELWKKIVNWAYTGWETTYADQGVVFDVIMYQSNYTKAGKEIVQLALEKGIAVKDPTGAVIAKLEKYGVPDKVLLRKDGTSVYITQDTQLAKDSFAKYHFDKRLYVVDSRQTDYFKQLFKLLEILGFDWANRLFHVAYGVVNLPEGGMSSRKGLVVNSDDVFAKVKELEEKEIKSSLKNIGVVEDTVKKVALGAFRYGMLKIDPKQDVVFSYEQVTKFEGNTGPYLMYTYARAGSVLEKGAYKENKEFDVSEYAKTEIQPRELTVLRALSRMPEMVLLSVEKLSPHYLANYAYDLAQKFNSFYGELPILDDRDSRIREFRLNLTWAVAQVLKNTLKLLGIEVVEKM
jgi:arginyl-tRNA synthetase